jgi:hypothetical protein
VVGLGHLSEAASAGSIVQDGDLIHGDGPATNVAAFQLRAPHASFDALADEVSF